MILLLALAGCSSAAKKPWYSPEKDASEILERTLKSGKKVSLAVLGRATADLTKKELEYFDLKKESWEKTRTEQESSKIADAFRRQFGAYKNLEVMDARTLDAIVLGRKFEDPGRPLEQEAAEVSNFAHASHLAYWTLSRIPYGQYKILDKFTLKLIEIASGRTLSIEVFQEVKR